MNDHQKRWETTPRYSVAHLRLETRKAHNDALERAAKAIKDYWEPGAHYRLGEILQVIRAVKESPNADR